MPDPVPPAGVAPVDLAPVVAPARPRNVVWFFGDQHRAATLGFAGDPNVRTPNVDALAAGGVVLNGVSGCPLCCPYRGSLLTGRYPHHAVPGHQRRLDPSIPTVAHAFADAGHDTAWFGKWHLDGFQERDGRAALHTVPRGRRGGFATWLGYENNNAPFDCHVHGHDESGEVDRYRLPGFETDALTDLLIAHVRRRAADGRPFFAAMSGQPPHNPYVAPERWMRRHTPGRVRLRANVPDVPAVRERARRELAGYHAMVENLDWNLGRLVAALDDAGLRETTTIIFFSDHGDLHGGHGQFLKTAPWQEAVSVPMVVGGPASPYAHRVGRPPGVLVNHVDLAPTSLGLCGLPAPGGMAGRDLSAAYLKGADPLADVDAPDSAYLQMVEPTRHGDSVDRPWRGVVTADGWKYVCLGAGPTGPGVPWLMFDLNADPLEQVNLAHDAAHATRRRTLHERLARWVADTGDRFDLADV